MCKDRKDRNEMASRRQRSQFQGTFSGAGTEAVGARGSTKASPPASAAALLRQNPADFQGIPGIPQTALVEKHSSWLIHVGNDPGRGSFTFAP